MHLYKIIAYTDTDGKRFEAAYRYADNPAQALAYYDEYTAAGTYSLVTIQAAVYKTVPITDFRKIYT